MTTGAVWLPSSGCCSPAFPAGLRARLTGSTTRTSAGWRTPQPWSSTRAAPATADSSTQCSDDRDTCWMRLSLGSAMDDDQHTLSDVGDAAAGGGAAGDGSISDRDDWDSQKRSDSGPQSAPRARFVYSWNQLGLACARTPLLILLLIFDSKIFMMHIEC